MKENRNLKQQLKDFILKEIALHLIIWRIYELFIYPLILPYFAESSILLWIIRTIVIFNIKSYIRHFLTKKDIICYSSLNLYLYIKGGNMFFRKEIECKNCRFYSNDNIDGYDYCYKKQQPIVPSNSCDKGKPKYKTDYISLAKKKIARFIKHYLYKK